MPTLDDTKANYASKWDIDQLFATNTVPVGVGTTAVYTIPGTIPAIPVYEVQLQVGGKWYQAGGFATSNTIATLQSFSTYISGNQIFITTGVAGTARYFVWTDKVNY
ncbi:hypothetical protein UFOVP253_37 [uncultured Caudovirales phage]|uniref:Uncharacterized protein n=1 Tax=uncultured Caudovirales phage TaxID=2100421 RepID=A0A6J5LLI2_9CAUD|nr:hypothetical protein UFOVP253_37 [uncultured Caudovirales phage]